MPFSAASFALSSYVAQFGGVHKYVLALTKVPCFLVVGFKPMFAEDGGLVEAADDADEEEPCATRASVVCDIAVEGSDVDDDFATDCDAAWTARRALFAIFCCSALKLKISANFPNALLVLSEGCKRLASRGGPQAHKVRAASPPM